jgi:Ca2+-binding RTX toxin-like protein
MTRHAITLAAGLLLALPGAAAADNTLTVVRGDAVFRSEDPGIANEFVVETSGNDIRFAESKDPYGINFPAQCRPGKTTNGPAGTVPVEVFCPRSAVAGSITVEAGPAEDDVRYAVNGIPAAVTGDTGADKLTATGESADVLTGGQGSDTLNAGPGNDELFGEDGNDTIAGGTGDDKITGGEGADTITGGDGADQISSRDGIADKVDCGPGADSVTADTIDEVVDCEDVQRQFVAPPSGQPAADDRTKPRLRAGAAASQRVSRRRPSIRIAATSSEKGLIQAAAYVDAGGVNSRLKPASARVGVAGGGAELRFRLSARILKLVRADRRRGRTPRARVTISSVDAAGNASPARHFWIRLR